MFSRTISLFTSQRRKPIFKQPLAHGLNESVSETEGVIQTPRWITALSTLRYSDIFVSGVFSFVPVSTSFINDQSLVLLSKQVHGKETFEYGNLIQSSNILV
jgi:hypothetical protein